MTQILDSLPVDCIDRRFCCCDNHDRTSKIARTVNTSNWYFECFVLPGEWLFEAPSEAELEADVARSSTVDLEVSL
jgi:hypothetical protein